MTDYVRKPAKKLPADRTSTGAQRPVSQNVATKQTTEKTIVGAVPAFPGMFPNTPLKIEIDSPTNEAASSAGDRNSISSLSSQISVSSVPAKPEPRYYLRHQDFMPILIKEKTLSEDEYEKFHVLIEKANAWLKSNRWATLFSCETIMWISTDRPVYHDNGVLQKSMGDKKSKMIRGLRLWFFTLDDTFYSLDNLPPPSTIGYVNCLLDPKSDSLTSIVKKLNKEMFKKPFPGKLCRVESLHMLSDHSDADVCFWKEQPDKDRQYYFFVRVLYIEKMEEIFNYGELGIRDFVPRLDQKTAHSSGYETYSDLWKRAARWVYMNPKNSLINIQSVYVKYKKGDNIDVELWDRCTYKEHGSAQGSLANQKTEYLQVLRIFYHQPVLRVEQGKEAEQIKMFYKNFSPTKLRKPGAFVEEKDKESDLSESSFEDMRMVEERLNSWLHFSDAHTFGVETVQSRLSTGGQETIGAEATFAYNSKEKCSGGRELIRNTFRIHIQGEYTETPTIWRRPMVDTSHFGSQ